MAGLLLFPSVRALDYQDHTELSRELRQLAEEHGHIMRVESKELTAGKHEIWAVELGAGSADDRKQRPGMLVVAGIEGNDLAGTAAVVHWLKHLVQEYEKDASVRNLLGSMTIYAFPRVNPDAAQSFFARPRVEQVTNRTPVDEDHDGLVDEDGPEDLDGDGVISWMRVQHPDGEYILDPRDARVLIKADRAKGEKGAWKLLTEGRDNDEDERWNEDGSGGVNLNRNFPYRFAFFTPHFGAHPMSEVETRALADFVVAHPNIGIAFTFGAADNLLQNPKTEPGDKRPPTAIHESDGPYYQELGRVYREALGLPKELTGNSEPGSFSDWIYFNRGRLSLAARPWTPHLQAELAKARRSKETKADAAKDEADDAEKLRNKEASKDNGAEQKTDEKKEEKEEPAPDKRGDEERAALKWSDANAPEAFIGWKEFSHPDFPEHRVEIGGWAPFATNNPPVKLLEEVSQRATFLTDLAGRLPRIGIRKFEAKHLGSGVYELTAQIENTGYLPTVLAHGARTREILRTRVLLGLTDAQVLAGEKVSFLGPIPGSGGMEELRYVVRATGPVELEVISALGGTVRQSIELKETL